MMELLLLVTSNLTNTFMKLMHSENNHSTSLPHPPTHPPYSAFQVSVQQGTPLYATVLVENHAETWSRFISQPVVMDTTPPSIDQLNVTITYSANASSLNVTAATAIAKWTVGDAESGSVSCTCELGKWDSRLFFLLDHRVFVVVVVVLFSLFRSDSPFYNSLG